MSRAIFTQCLLFSVRKKSHSITAAQTSSASASNTTYYALLPKVFKTEHRKLLKLFTQNDVVVMSNSDGLSPKFIEGDDMEMIEVLLRMNSATANSNLSLIAEDIHLQMVGSIFCKTAVDISSYSKATKVCPAVDASNASIMKRILSRVTNICYKHPSGESLLHLAARRGHETLVKVILEHGIDVNSKCSDGSTPLLAAVSGGHRVVVDILIQNGAKVESKTNSKSTALHVAVEKRHTDIVEILLQNGANVDSKIKMGSTALHVAAEKGHRRIVEILLQNGATVESKMKNGSTALAVAVEKDHCSVVEALLCYGANRDVRNKAGSTVLLVAVSKGYREMAEVLLENGADVDCKDADGRTPLFIAAKEGRLETVKVLLSYGARLDVKLADGRFLAEDVAIEKHDQVFQCLLESCFCDSEILEETGAFGRFRQIKKWMTKWGSDDIFWQYLYGRHVVKIVAANFHSLTPLVQLSSKDKDEFMAECESEVERMKRLTIGNTKVTFFDVLTDDVSQVARCLKNRNIAQILNSDNLNHTFPKYSGVLKSQFRKGTRRKLAVAESLKIIHRVSGLFKKLPCEIKERIFDYLSVRDILILKHVNAQTNV